MTALIFVFLFLPSAVKKLHDTFWQKDTSYSDSVLLQAWIDSIENKQLLLAKPSGSATIVTAENITKFDPNAVTKEELLKLGFSSYAASNLVNYIKKGGRISIKKDLLKIYSIDTSLITNVLWDSIDLPMQRAKKRSSNRQKANNQNSYTKRTPVAKHIWRKKDINRASASDLRKVRGIGAWYSKCICGYRDELGGYISMNQLIEKCNLKEKVLNELTLKFNVDSTYIRQINLNSSPSGVLSQHPYISRKLADQIVLYRLHHGNFKTIYSLKDIKTVSRDLFDRISPYLIIK